MSLHPIRKFRLSKKPPVSLEQLATLAGTTKATISRIERGTRTPSLDLASRLSRATGIPIDRFVRTVGQSS